MVFIEHCVEDSAALGVQTILTLYCIVLYYVGPFP